MPYPQNFATRSGNKIWELVVIEPTIWDRRHKPACSFHDEKQVSQRTVHKSSCPRDRKTNRNGSTDQASEAELDSCHQLCVRRAGLGLLATCRQIYNEAGSIFYADTTFCWSNRNSFVTDVNALSERSRANIRRISLFEDDSTTMLTLRTGRDDGEPETFKALRNLPALTHVEVPLSFFTDKFPIIDLRALTSLNATWWTAAKIDCSIVDARYNRSSQQAAIQVHMLHELRWPRVCLAPSPDSEGHAGDESKPDCTTQFCSHCQAVWGRSVHQVQTWTSYDEAPAHEVMDVVYARLRRRLPAHPTDGTPYTVDIRLNAAFQQHVKITGLPILTPDGIFKLLKDEQKALRRQRKQDLARSNVGRVSGKVPRVESKVPTDNPETNGSSDREDRAKEKSQKMTMAAIGERKQVERTPARGERVKASSLKESREVKSRSCQQRRWRGDNGRARVKGR